MAKLSLNDLNQIMLLCLKNSLVNRPKLKGRIICLFSLVDNGRGQYVGMIMDKLTSLSPRFMIPKEHSEFYGTDVMMGIVKGLLEALEQTIVKVRPCPFNWRKTPIKAKGRTCILDGEIKVTEDVTLELYSWSKLIV